MCGFNACNRDCVTKLGGFKGGGTHSYYAEGYRFCGGCAFYMKTTSNYCECCGRKLRIRPRAQTRYRYNYYRNKGHDMYGKPTLWAKLREKHRVR